MKQILALLWIVLTMACSSPHGEGYRLYVQLKVPGDIALQTASGTEVKLINTDNGTTYRALADTNGLASFDAEYGIYRLSAQLTWQEDAFSAYLLNAGLENVLLTSGQGAGQDTIDIQLTNSPLSQIIIKEVYYSGCYDEKQYAKDGYLSIYNNSDRTVWLDSLCVGTIGPGNATKISPWLTYTPDKLAVIFMGWQFPGSGHDYPLEPGQETVIAINAVNHCGNGYNHPNSVDLSTVDWAFYDTSLTMQDITPGVKPLNLFLSTSPAKSYMFGLTGAGFILYHIKETTATEYAGNPDNLSSEPPAYSGMKYLMIPANWIIDCVDCVGDATKQGFKRVPSYLDAESTYLPSGTYSGRSLHRKILENRDGRIIYQDTNNSANDFEERVPTRKG